MAWVVVWLLLGAACTSESGSHDEVFARATAVAQLAYGPSMHCGESEFGYGYTCSGEVNCYDTPNGGTVVWECVHGHDMEGNPRTCVIEQNGKLRITRREDDPGEC